MFTQSGTGSKRTDHHLLPSAIRWQRRSHRAGSQIARCAVVWQLDPDRPVIGEGSADTVFLVRQGWAVAG